MLTGLERRALPLTSRRESGSGVPPPPGGPAPPLTWAFALPRQKTFQDRAKSVPNPSAVKPLTSGFAIRASPMGEDPVALMPIEVGGVNTLVPIATAVEMGIPIIDAGGMRRAFPQIEMTVFTLHGLMAAPMSIADEKGNMCVFEATTNQTAESLARAAVVQLGLANAISCYPMTVADVRRAPTSSWPRPPTRSPSRPATSSPARSTSPPGSKQSTGPRSSTSARFAPPGPVYEHSLPTGSPWSASIPTRPGSSGAPGRAGPASRPPRPSPRSET